ncbi:hypothetical protein BKA69DRAFT_1126360 [Paraphysoderma sedebokerense]|nr:hypothetical protein BKA69DRAFT_1126360 [Paraphysoderma sedebokerense]
MTIQFHLRQSSLSRILHNSLLPFHKPHLSTPLNPLRTLSNPTRPLFHRSLQSRLLYTSKLHQTTHNVINTPSTILRRCGPSVRSVYSVNTGAKGRFRFFASLSDSTGSSPGVRHSDVIEKTRVVKESELSLVERLKVRGRKLMWWVGVPTVLYIFYYTTSSITDFTMSHSLLDIGEIGFFIGGILTTLLFSSVYVIGKRYGITTGIRGIEKEMVEKLKRDRVLRSKIGVVEKGKIEFHGFVGGWERTKKEVWGIRGWKWTGPRHVIVLLTLQSPSDTAVVTAHISKPNLLSRLFSSASSPFSGSNVGGTTQTKYIYHSMVVDIDKLNERLVYYGSERDAVFRGLIRVNRDL